MHIHYIRNTNIKNEALNIKTTVTNLIRLKSRNKKPDKHSQTPHKHP